MTVLYAMHTENYIIKFRWNESFDKKKKEGEKLLHAYM